MSGKISFSPTKVLPLPLLPSTRQILLIGLLPPPIAPILDPELIACIDHGDSSSYGILGWVGEGTVYPL
ncbi:hypothetical protein [uncultured Porphyromonas sp.]|uniref:hypothetical protein n=1 Tax=uncultured Porphyromonas sp. TaxID=159274 RepID=UPI0026073B7C|nr:hypothetical protein [uncultured Porphyromonas sp.]